MFKVEKDLRTNILVMVVRILRSTDTSSEGKLYTHRGIYLL